ncbi:MULTISPECIES: phosphatase PAP2 family protein [Streptomyces]|uniref:phosphatase PAP2 family protein n=1 Tax=Streptomyces scabiei TaxID=1930 RepID=UPI001B31364B|nr:phosphatase PAP2 family protein [Streptomyces sp. LBUM 1486]MBP5926887.1 phosphatase PAP2 family protein [Streptomyces sp. LBUM 1479]QTU59559.1 phosphatase PAP2 family protein [Streptomyces sp. LBUM 1480]
MPPGWPRRQRPRCFQQGPSGHTTAAVAFFVAVAPARPAVGAACGAAAVLVGARRLRSGAHCPAGVAVGAAIGPAGAALGPGRPGTAAARPVPTRSVPPLPGGRPCALPCSGVPGGPGVVRIVPGAEEAPLHGRSVSHDHS